MNNIDEALAIFMKKDFLRSQKNYKEQEVLRKKFVEKYPINIISNLSLDEYVVGKGANNKSFCYCLENDLKGYGDIHGSFAFKFGVYYSKENNNYITTKVWSESLNTDEAFNKIKQEIVILITAGAICDIDAINNSKIAPMFKYKIIATYYPEKYMCIFSPEHINHYCQKLNIDSKNMTTIEKNLALVTYKENNSITKIWDNFTFQKFLYFWKDPRNIENTYSEEQYESYLNATDINAGYIYSEKLVKARKVNQKILTNLKIEYDSNCQICGKSFDSKYDSFVVEGHHIEYFSKSENNDANNIILLCPNHHRIIHKANAIFDREKMVFRYKNGYEDKVILDIHLNKK